MPSEGEFSGEAERRRLAELIGRELPRIANAATDQILSDVAGYRESAVPNLRREVLTHVLDVFDIFVRALKEGLEPRADRFRVTADQAMRRVTQGISMPDFLRAFRVAQITLWESIRQLTAEQPDLRFAASEAVSAIMEVIEVGTTAAAEAYLEAERFLVADATSAARDLIDDLLAGQQPVTGPRQAALRTAGLSAGSVIVVVAGRVVGYSGERNTLVRVLGKAATTYPHGLLAMRRNEIVGVLPAPIQRGIGGVLRDLRRVADKARAGGVELALGVSTPLTGLDAAPPGYCEAKFALGALHGRPGIQALGELTTFDYLVSRDDPIARRLISPQVRGFVEKDLAGDRMYIDTLLAYVEANLNAKAAADALYVHSNTAYYRLERIAERTGKDLRAFSEVLDLLVAIKLLAPA
ncbi:PucR family transcriptional regulator [Hoyosella subflava]|uniref:Putative CdaR family transcriptional regulator n=1 Tax=Hoyosella subflava (strain DSM 45089 / JCM 17490 / NBRC 109087 / DQS3-9A1) TaxID=443218 RepID=F6EMQ6_HOYSD|nr:helix-turn-helix domain-containing protein [Hoyosella subflava]AEF41614.1 Putative CdaR family transcriptional regulator [Hoyosella subflava DQS3-9A1]